MINIENLTKKFDEITAVEGLTFHVKEGEVFGFLGPNGAGKTTTVRMLCCLISNTRGEARIADYHIGKATDSLPIRKMTGLVPDNVGLYDDLTAFENLDFYGKLYECPEVPKRENIKRFLKMLDLWERKDARAGSFSKGNDAFNKLYGYASDSDGIRHALSKETGYKQEDAIFMLVACSAFVNYLKVKAFRIKT